MNNYYSFRNIPMVGVPRGGGGGGGSATFQDYRWASNAAAGSTLSTTSLNVLSGSFVIAYVAGTGASDHPPTAVTIGSQSMTMLVGTTDGGGTPYWLSCWYLANATSDSSAVATALWNPVDNSAFRNIFVAEYTGVAASSPADGNSNVSTGTTANLATSSANRTAQNITTTNANDLLLGYYLNYNVTATGTGANSFVLRGGTGTQPSNLMEKVVSSTGSYPSGNFATTSPSDQYMSLFTAWKLA